MEPTDRADTTERGSNEKDLPSFETLQTAAIAMRKLPQLKAQPGQMPIHERGKWSLRSIDRRAEHVQTQIRMNGQKAKALVDTESVRRQQV